MRLVEEEDTPPRLKINRVAAWTGAVCIGLFALAAFGATPPGAALPIQWGTLADSGTVVLLDSGVQTSMCVSNPAGQDAIVCIATDAGTPGPLGTITLLGSNDCVNAHAIALSPTQVIPSSTVVAWDPINSGMAFYSIQVDAGGTVSGSVTCTMNNKGGQP